MAENKRFVNSLTFLNGHLAQRLTCPKLETKISSLINTTMEQKSKAKYHRKTSSAKHQEQRSFTIRKDLNWELLILSRPTWGISEKWVDCNVYKMSELMSFDCYYLLSGKFVDKRGWKLQITIREPLKMSRRYFMRTLKILLSIWSQ